MKRLWLLAALAATAPFWSLGHPLVEVDDARYAEVPREMAAAGDWATPRLDGMDYVEKPPLWYWLCAASYRLFGVSETAARLPLALLALAALAGAWRLGSWAGAPRDGLAAAAILGTSALFFFLSHYITPDLGLTAWLAWCSALVLRALERPKDARWAGPAAWLFAGLAFLSKGLVALVFPAAWTVLLIVLRRGWRDRKSLVGLLNPLGPLLFLAVAAPWFFLMEKRHPGFFHFFFVEQHFQRFATAKYNRSSPWWFFLLVAPAGLLPWTPLALAGLKDALRRRAEPADLALAAWAVLVVAFFSLSQSKLATYILPAFPQLAVLAARAASRRPPWSARLGRLAAAGLALGALSLVGLNLSRFTTKWLAREIETRLRPGDRVYSYGIFLHGVPFYLGRPYDKVVNWTGELHYARRDAANAARFGDESDIRALDRGGAERAFIVLRSFELDQVLSWLPPERVRLVEPFGSWALIETGPRP